jgi:cob(I)alamin adenosyltransferase
VEGRHDESTPGSGQDAPVEELTEAGRARIRTGLEAQRRRPDRRNKGLVIVNTGNGKGKTTAALGIVLRAWGRDLRVIMLQFIKHQTANWGESRAAQKLGIEIIPLGSGFTWLSKDLDQDRVLARAGWERCRAAIESSEYDIVILDELTYCFKYGWLDLADVIEVLRQRPEGQHVIVTGRDAPPELIDFADLVTEMREIKHPFAAGVKAQKGIEF